MFTSFFPRKRRSLVLFLAAFMIDLLSKEWALRTLPAPSFRGGAGFFALALHFNPGAAFSLFRSMPGTAAALAVAGILVLLLMRRLFPAFRRSPAEALLFAGAAGNLADRVLHGHVVDWLKVGPLHLNAADFFLCLGALLFLNEIVKQK
jgi:signal peptidase II